VRLELKIQAQDPETVQDQAYLRDVLNIRHNGDFAKLVAFMMEGGPYPLLIDLTAGDALIRYETIKAKASKALELPPGRTRRKLIGDLSGTSQR
jgi:hypothetical protein